MSVTLRIANDKDQSIVNTYDCQSCSWNGKIDPNCKECGGKGSITFTSSQWELNQCNANFDTIFSALGLISPEDAIDSPLGPVAVGCCGEIDPRAIIKAINSYIPGLAVRDSLQDQNIYSGGLSEYQVQERFAIILRIAKEAERREEKIVWG